MNGCQRGIYASIVAALLVATTPAHAEVAPFYSRNLNPFIHIFGLPATEGATLAPAGRVDTKLVLDFVNNSTQKTNGTEQVVKDGDLVYAAGFTHLIPHAAAHEVIRQTPKTIHGRFHKITGRSADRNYRRNYYRRYY